MIGKIFTASILAVTILAITVSLDKVVPTIGFIANTIAQTQSNKTKTQRETRRTPALRNKVYETLAKAQASAETKDYKTAEAILNKMVSDRGKQTLNSYELANVYNLYAFLRYSTEDFKGALDYYYKVIAQPDIPLAMEANTLFTVAQLHFVQEDWHSGVKALLKWFGMTDKPNADAYILLGQGYYQIKQYTLALENVEFAIDLYESEGKLPKEQWYNLARFLYLDKEDYDNTLATLKSLIKYYPKKQYWVQASHLYGNKKDEIRQLAMMETAYEQDILDKDPDIVTMAYLYLQAETPYFAALVIEKGFEAEILKSSAKNYELAGNAWRQAREIKKSIPMMEQAATQSKNGELYAQLGNVYFDGDQNEKTIEAIIKGLAKGGVKRSDQAHLVLGMAYFNVGNYSGAHKAFREAAKDKRSEKYAHQWIEYIQSEYKRQQSLVN